jgi:hypothetical protein
VRVGAADQTIENTETLTQATTSSFDSGILLYSTGAIHQVGKTSIISTHGGDSYAAVTNGNMLYSATYTFDQGNNYQRQATVFNGGRFTISNGDQENIIWGNKMDWNLGNHSRIFAPIKFEEIFGLSVKYAPIEVGLSTNKIELKGGYLAGVIEPSASLKGLTGVTLACNPAVDTPFIGGAVTAYNTTFTLVNGIAVTLTSVFGAIIANEAWVAWGGQSEEKIKDQLKAIRDQFIAVMVLFAVTEATALVLAAIALTMRAVQPVADWPTGCEVKMNAAGVVNIKSFGMTTSNIVVSPFGIDLNGPMINQRAAAVIHTPVPLPPPVLVT